MTENLQWVGEFEWEQLQSGLVSVKGELGKVRDYTKTVAIEGKRLSGVMKGLGLAFAAVGVTAAGVFAGIIQASPALIPALTRIKFQIDRIFKTLAPYVEPFLMFLGDVLEKIAMWIERNPKLLQQLSDIGMEIASWSEKEVIKNLDLVWGVVEPLWELDSKILEFIMPGLEFLYEHKLKPIWELIQGLWGLTGKILDFGINFPGGPVEVSTTGVSGVGGGFGGGGGGAGGGVGRSETIVVNVAGNIITQGDLAEYLSKVLLSKGVIMRQ